MDDEDGEHSEYVNGAQVIKSLGYRLNVMQRDKKKEDNFKFLDWVQSIKTVQE